MRVNVHTLEDAGTIAAVGASPIWLDLALDGMVVLKLVALFFAAMAALYLALRERNRFLREKSRK